MISKDKPVLLLAETGFIIRNLLLGYFAGEISRSRKLLVAVKNPQDKLLQELIKGSNIELIEFPALPVDDPRTPFRKVVSWDNAIYNLKMVMKDNESLRLQTLLYEGRYTGKSAIVNDLFKKAAKGAKVLGLASGIEDMYISRYVSNQDITHAWYRLIKKHDPAVVFSSMLTLSTRYRYSSDLPALVAARKLGIKTCTLVQSWDNLSSKTSVLPPWLDMYYTWSNVMTDELLQYNDRIDRNKVKVVGSPQYDFHLNKDLLEPRDKYVAALGLDPQRRYILIGTGTAKWMPDEMEKMISLCLAVSKAMPDMQCLIRLHPKDHGERWAPYLDKLAQHGIALQYTSPDTHMDQGGFIPPKDFYRDQVNTIYHSALVINSSSSITVDAAIFDRPVICIAYDLHKDKLFPEGRSLGYSRSAHYSRLTDTGGVKVVYSEAECVNAIIAYVNDPSLQREERKKIVQAVASDLTQKAGITLAAEIEALAHSG